ncbi:MAG: DUF1127 domain-containing protein [Gammaproteobacteria bacterium]|nr:DUF1127 domain-containing protein [Gammaproteobacteria bacterium]
MLVSQTTRTVARLAAYVKRPRRRRQAILELRTLDARLLADLGVEPDAVPELVDGLLESKDGSCARGQEDPPMAAQSVEPPADNPAIIHLPAHRETVRGRAVPGLRRGRRSDDPAARKSPASASRPPG